MFVFALYAALDSAWKFLLKLDPIDLAALVFWSGLMAAALGAKMTYSGGYRILGPQLYALGLLTLTVMSGAGVLLAMLNPPLAARIVVHLDLGGYPFLSGHTSQMVFGTVFSVYCGTLFVAGILRVPIPTIVMDLSLGAFVIADVLLSGYPTFEVLWVVGIVLFFLEVRHRWTRKLFRF